MNSIEGNIVFGPSKFADLSAHEFEQVYLSGYRRSAAQQEMRELIPHHELFEKTTIPAEYNWADQGATTSVYNQGQCGSCWAFSATEQIESMYYLKHHAENSSFPIQEMSMQQIVSCDVGRGDLGCNGGDTPTAYEYVMSQGGLDSLQSYPYEGITGHCKFNNKTVVGKISGWQWVTPNTTDGKNETQMLYYIATEGPASICVDAASWQLYFGGIIRFFCGQDLDHCVQLTGYGTEGSTDYWIIRNSWGELWGEHGFLRVERNKNLCGVADEVTTVVAV